MIIALQSTYTGIDIGLYNNAKALISTSIDKKQACAQLIPTLDRLLKAMAISSLHDIQCMIVNKGPGPFTTLRTVIVTVNGIAFSTHIPIIGVSALETMVYEYDPNNTKTVLAVLNAYGKEYYYGFKKAGEFTIVGICPHNSLPTYTDQTPINIIGQTENLSSEQLAHYKNAYIVSNNTYSTLHGIITYALNTDQKTVQRLSPLYIKTHF